MSSSDRKEYFRNYYNTNKDKYRGYAEKYRRLNKEKHLEVVRKYNSREDVKQKRKVKTKNDYNKNRNKHLMRCYGIGIEEYTEIEKSQGGCCAICGAKPEDCPRGVLYVDHDHKTDEVRGLLCSNCNTLIGMSFENKNILFSAMSYLERYEK